MTLLALGALLRVSNELVHEGTCGFWESAAVGSKTVTAAFARK